VARDWRGRGRKGSAYMVWPIRKDLAVTSEWARCPWNLESPEAAPPWPVAMAGQPAKQKETGGRCPCLEWKSSLLINAKGDGAGMAVAHGWPEHKGLGDSILHSFLSYLAPWILVSTGLCTIWA
jgi:hypothetical protein